MSSLRSLSARAMSSLRSLSAGRSLWFLVTLALLAWPLSSPGDYFLSVMVVAGLYAMLALGLSLLLGQAGQISLGHAAFFGLGAYTSGVLSTRFSIPTLAALLAGACLSGLVAYVVGRPVLRLKSYFLALATLGLGGIFTVFVREARWLTGGLEGVVGVPWLSVGRFAFDDYLKQYYAVWILALLLLLLSQQAMRSRVGRALHAIAVSEITASTLGIEAARWKLRTFVLSAVYAGLAGGLYALFFSAISWMNFTTELSILVVIMVMLGGMRSLSAGLLGAVLLTWMSRSLSGYQQYSGLLYAVVLLLLLLFLPGGVTGGLRPRHAAWLRCRVSRLGRPLAGRPAAVTPSGSRPAEKTAYAEATACALRPAPSQRANGNRSVAASGPPLLQLEDVSVYFGGLQAVGRVSLSIPKGVTAAVIGPNGAGKTTLFDVISGLRSPHAGRILFAGEDITGWSPVLVVRLGIARTFQNLRLFPNMNVLENVMAGRHRHERAGFVSSGLGLPSQRREERRSRERSLEVLALMGLADYAEWPAVALPYGRQRLVEIARALATEPDLLLLDEPAAGMNSAERGELIEKIAAIRESGVTVLIVEHDMNLVMGISDQVSVLDHGSLISEGAPGEVREHPAVIEAYLGGRGRQTRKPNDGALEVAGAKDGRPGGDGRQVAGAKDGRLDDGALEVTGVSVCYGSISAVRNVSFRIDEGRIVALLGANGAGKSTLLRALSGTIPLAAGHIRFGGKEMTGLPAPQIVAAGISHVPEGRHVFPTLSVQDNLLLGAYRRRDRDGVREDRDYVYQLFPVLADRRHQSAGTLSGGEQQMLAIGRALMNHPRLLLLDEPSMGLAPQVVEHIFEVLAALNKGGLTLLMVEQNAEMALSIADEALVLQTGEVALMGSAADLLRDERILSTYLGDRPPPRALEEQETEEVLLE
ncbi:MAG: ATP-binding cassette domain-containing protein [Actinobacteria bacterium]|nr:ATP-binding cassette domain-containing protein [Actinomycetota bacterium]